MIMNTERALNICQFNREKSQRTFKLETYSCYRGRPLTKIRTFRIPEGLTAREMETFEYQCHCRVADLMAEEFDKIDEIERLKLKRLDLGLKAVK